MVLADCQAQSDCRDQVEIQGHRVQLVLLGLLDPLAQQVLQVHQELQVQQVRLELLVLAAVWDPRDQRVPSEPRVRLDQSELLDQLAQRVILGPVVFQDSPV